MDFKMNARVFFIFLLGANLVLSELRPQSYMGQADERVTVQSVGIEDGDTGRRTVTVYFDATEYPQVLWQVGGKAVMDTDRSYFTASSNNYASLNLGPENAQKTVSFSVILSVYQESVIIRLSGSPAGSYPISNHSLTVTPGETFTYSTGDSVDIDALLYVEEAARYRRLRVKARIMIPDYCSRPIKPIYGFTSSNPDMIQMTSADRGQEFLDDADWSTRYPADKSVAKRIHVTSVSTRTQRQGMVDVGSEFEAESSSDPVRSVRTVRRILFKPSDSPYQFIIQNTVAFIGFQQDLVVDENGSADFHVFAIGNPAPRILLAKDGVDISTRLPRRDIEEAYYKHVIFRFQNVTVQDAGRYICTALSGDGRIKQSFVLYVRSDCQ